MSGDLRAYLEALLAERARAIISPRQGGRMKIVFEGGPRDGEERDTTAKQALKTIRFSSLMMRDEKDQPLAAVYELFEDQLEPRRLVRYRFVGWKQAGVA